MIDAKLYLMNMLNILRMNMKILFILLSVLYSFKSTITQANEIYYGIDVNEIVTKNDILYDNVKNTIDDYTLLLQYELEFNNCTANITQNKNCYDDIANKILKKFYMYSDVSVKQYENFKTVLNEIYGIKHCRNKYLWPSGYMCEFEVTKDMLQDIEKYIKGLLFDSKIKMLNYMPELANYKARNKQ